MASSLLPVRFHPPPSRIRKNPNPSFSSRFLPIRASSHSSTPGPSWEREEIRWLREEQRWLREEQRWLQEESRWNSERDVLLREISTLKLRIEALERERPSSSVPDAVANFEAMLRALKDRVSESGGSRATPVLAEEADVKEMVLEEIRVVEGVGERKKKSRALRKGSEGEDVQAMQKALERLGFYSGDEDMEYASFSSGTERAVKTWQASLGTSEDGIMTTELLERLFVQLGTDDAGLNVNAEQKGDFVKVTERDAANGAAVASVTGVSEVQRTVINDTGVTAYEVSEHKVFLLGENRWEDSSRLVGRNKPTSGSNTVSGKRCLTCRGEGHLMCTECDGTGEPNIEPQFLEWVDEGVKCPYCEGLGYTICDVCEGRATVQP